MSKESKPVSPYVGEWRNAIANSHTWDDQADLPNVIDRLCEVVSALHRELLARGMNVDEIANLISQIP